MTELGKAFRAWREKKQLTIPQAAELLSVCTATVERIEAGRRIKPATARQLTPVPFRKPWWRLYEMSENHGDA